MTPRDLRTGSRAVARAVLVGTAGRAGHRRLNVRTAVRFAVAALLVTVVVGQTVPDGLVGACLTSGLLAFYFVGTRSAGRTPLT